MQVCTYRRFRNTSGTFDCHSITAIGDRAHAHLRPVSPVSAASSTLLARARASAVALLLSRVCRHASESFVLLTLVCDVVCSHKCTYYIHAPPTAAGACNIGPLLACTAHLIAIRSLLSETAHTLTCALSLRHKCTYYIHAPPTAVGACNIGPLLACKINWIVHCIV